MGRVGVAAEVRGRGGGEARDRGRGGVEVRGCKEGRGQVKVEWGARQQRLERQCRRRLTGRRASCRRW